MKRLVRTVWFALILGLAASTLAASEYQRTEDVIYGRKFGTALTLDVFQPPKPNGYGIVLMVSGGFFSSHEAINPRFFNALLQRGYAVFAGSMGRSQDLSLPRLSRTSIALFGLFVKKIGIRL